jgi:hypothetical protein
MKKYMSSFVIAFFAIAIIALAAPPDKEAIKAKETAAWQAFKDKKADDFKKLLSVDVQAVYSDSIANLQKELDDMQKWDMKSFAISDYTATPVGADTLVTTYKVAIEGSVEGKDMSGTYNAGSVWKREKGAWKAIFHTNVKVEAAAATAPTPVTTP